MKKSPFTFLQWKKVAAQNFAKKHTVQKTWHTQFFNKKRFLQGKKVGQTKKTASW